MQKQKIFLLSLLAVFSLFFALFDFSQANELSYELRGRILLQVEDHGRLWYVNPNNLQAFELKRENYQEKLAEVAVGISNENLEKLAMDADFVDPLLDSDADGYPDETELRHGYDPFGPGRWQGDYILAENLAGKILLQTEDRGRLWYVNPENLKRYEIKKNNWADFFQKNSLGISNKDFSNILQAEERLSWGHEETASVELFVQNFRKCEAFSYEMKLNDDFILEYEIVAGEAGRCRVLSRFLANPNEDWVNKEMTCLYDNQQLSIQKALTEVFEDGAAHCEGPLFDLFKFNDYD